MYYEVPKGKFLQELVSPSHPFVNCKLRLQSPVLKNTLMWTLSTPAISVEGYLTINALRPQSGSCKLAKLPVVRQYCEIVVGL